MMLMQSSPCPFVSHFFSNFKETQLLISLWQKLWIIDHRTAVTALKKKLGSYCSKSTVVTQHDYLTLERANELQLSPEAISAIQTALQLMKNMNSMAVRN